MLVLTRKEGESIIIDTGNDKIEIILTEINGSSARIGIEAKADINILRKEILESEETK